MEFGPIAQSAECRSLKPEVAGSMPARASFDMRTPIGLHVLQVAQNILDNEKAYPPLNILWAEAIVNGNRRPFEPLPQEAEQPDDGDPF